MIQYKTIMLNDKLFVKVNPQYTSQECSHCGNIDKNNRPKQDKFKCTACGFETNPDILPFIFKNMDNGKVPYLLAS